MGGLPQKPTEEWTVKIETFGNQTVTGKLRLSTRSWSSASVGTYEIKPEQGQDDPVRRARAGRPGEL